LHRTHTLGRSPLQRAVGRCWRQALLVQIRALSGHKQGIVTEPTESRPIDAVDVAKSKADLAAGKIE